MRYLVLMTLVWAFSFSLIGEFLAGRVDSYFAVLIRVALASLIFVPFTKFNGVSHVLKLKILVIGIVQIGLMYIFFYKSFLFLRVPEVILFTIFTPLYVTLVYDALRFRFRPLYLLSAGIAVLGAYIIRYEDISSDFVVGFLMVQGANLCFAIGQSAYKKVMEHESIPQHHIFGYFHFGALFVSLVAFMIFGNMEKIDPSLTQWGVLLWLGIVASGAGYFLWNKGACLVDSGVLAIMNNALVPVGLLVNIVFWGRETNYVALSIGSVVILLSLWVHKRIMQRYM